MTKSISKAFIIISIFFFSYQLKAFNQGKITIPKAFVKPDTSIKINKLPPLPMFKAGEVSSLRGSSLGNKVLVIMVDFIEDTTTNTTGNGKFDLSEYGTDDYKYPIHLGAPPHNNEYFRAIMGATRYYYLAASYGSYDLQYDVFPKPENKIAYTMPKKMEYYNPGVGTSNFVTRTEEYFKDAFTVADKDPAITFSNYDYYIVIHAGSDWQRDTKKDSPNDLPTMHVSLQPKAWVSVDEGSTNIKYAISIPETIAQDGSYGITTANVCHEFGHALGLIDLYNVANHRPMVGYWDIMDSGGSISLTLEGINPETNKPQNYTVDGILPTLPGAYSKLLLWGEENLKQRGLLKEIDSIDFNKPIFIAPAGYPIVVGNNTRIIKVPISEDEYLLVENRQVDADGDGLTALLSALAQTPDDPDNLRYRVVLYPSPVADNTGTPAQNYEYDYLLPGWKSELNNYYGGGLIVWHINNKIIHKMGSYNADGEWVSNFDNNSVNTNSRDLGVKIIEADNFVDIGNPYVRGWWGTAYEPFFRDKPKLTTDKNGNTFWAGLPQIHEGADTTATHNDAYTLTSKPKNTDSFGNATAFKIYNISNVPYKENTPRYMSFRIGYNNFNNVRTIPEKHYNFKSSKILDFTCLKTNEYMAGIQQDIATFTADSLYFFYHQYSQDTDNWEYYSSFKRELKFNPDLGYLQANILNSEGGKEIISANGNTLTLSSIYRNVEIKFDEEIIAKPAVLSLDGKNYAVVATKSKLFIKNTDGDTIKSYDFIAKQLLSTNNQIFALGDSKMIIIENLDENPKNFDLPKKAKLKNFVYYASTKNPSYNCGFASDANSNIWKFSNFGFEKIFTNHLNKDKLISNLAIGYNKNNKPFVAFGIDEYAYAIHFDGSNVSGFPYFLENKQIKPNANLVIAYLNQTDFDNDALSILYPSNKNGFYSVKVGEGYSLFSSFNFESKNSVYQLFYEEAYKKLYLISNNSTEGLRVAYNKFTVQNKNSFNPIIWQNSSNNGYLIGNYSKATTALNNLKVTAYPNPAKHGYVRIKLQNNTNSANLKIFDIAGNIVHKLHINNPEDGFEFIIDTKNYASGVYYAIVKTKNKTVKTPFIIEK